MRLYLNNSFWESLRVPCRLFVFLLWELIKMAVVAVLCIGIAKAIFFLLDEPDPLNSDAMTRAISKFENDFVKRREMEKSRERERENEIEKELHELLERRIDSTPPPAGVAEAVVEALPHENPVS